MADKPGGAPHKRVVPATLDDARAVLRETFGHADFRGLQAEVIEETLAGRSRAGIW